MNKRNGSFSLAVLLTTAMLTGGCSKPPEASAPMNAPKVIVGNVSDIDVTEHVKTVLHQSPLLQGFDIKVVTTNGDVRLTGVLASQFQVDEAINIARAAEGTHSIHDELTLKK